MKSLHGASIKYEKSQLWVLDQTLLPQQETWLPCDTVTEMVALIQRLAIRGAPIIGISASLLLGHLAEQELETTQLLEAARVLREARPTAVNLMNCMDRMRKAIETQSVATIVSEAEAIFDEDVLLCQSIAAHGAELIQPNDHILTHCHTGALVTAGIGTALGVICAAHKQNKAIHVYVDETRPLLQGGRLTTWELGKNQVPHTLICDNMAASLMRQGKINKVFVGADRIARNGDFANKIGTYSTAVCAHYHGIPFYVVAPRTTLDLNCPDASHIPIEERHAEEVRGVSGQFGSITWAPQMTHVYNPSFDVTPAELVTGWILDSGIYTQNETADFLTLG